MRLKKPYLIQNKISTDEISKTYFINKKIMDPNFILIEYLNPENYNTSLEPWRIQLIIPKLNKEFWWKFDFWPDSHLSYEKIQKYVSQYYKPLYFMEELCREIFEDLFNISFPKSYPKWLKGLELDGYCKKLSLAFEYNGTQHYTFVKFFHINKNGFKKLKERDKKKKALCIQNKVNLIIIPHYIKTSNLANHIIKECEKQRIKLPPI